MTGKSRNSPFANIASRCRRTVLGESPVRVAISWSEARGCRIRPRRTRKSRDESVASVGEACENGGGEGKGGSPRTLTQAPRAAAARQFGQAWGGEGGGR